MEILKSSAPIDVDDLAEVENKTGVKLPPGIDHFYLNTMEDAPGSMRCSTIMNTSILWGTFMLC